MKAKYFYIILLLNITLYRSQCQAIKITKVSALNQDSSSVSTLNTEPIKFSYKQTHILIEFFDSLDQNASYAVKLKGFDQNWMKIQASNSANYINLPGGKYEFMVKNLNFESKIETLKFNIEEAFWQKIWFVPSLAGYLLFVLGLIYYLFQTARQKQELRLQKVRNEIAADMHDDIGATLSNINLLTGIAKNAESKSKIDEILSKISSNSKEMIHTMRGLVWTVNAENDNAIDYFEKIKNYVEAMALQKNVEINFENSTFSNHVLSIEMQRNYFLIVKEIVNNCNKYSKADLLKYTLMIQNNWLMCQIEDNGIGFDLSKQTYNNGLKNIKNRTEELGGNIEIKTAENEGVRFRISIPVN